MARHLRVWLGLLLVGVAFAVAVAAQDSVPALVQVGGALTDQQGKPLVGRLDVAFALYKEQSDNAPLWIETQTVTADSSGRFVALLGATSATGLPLDLFSTGQARWLGMQAAGQPEQPRTFLASVPYALAPLSALSNDSKRFESVASSDPTDHTPKSVAAVQTSSPASALASPPLSPVFTIVTDSTSGLTSTASSNGATVTLSLARNCSVGQLLKWNGTSWGCTSDTDVKIGVTGGGLNVLANATSPNIVGGFSGNTVPSGAAGATIAGGGESRLDGALCLPFPAPCRADNRVTQSFGTVGGGEDNQAGDSAGAATFRSFATVGGGHSNIASGQYSTIPGGFQNAAAGMYSFAAGRSAKANHDGSFVWADNSSATSTATSGPNQFLIRAAGGVRVRGPFNLDDSTSNGVGALQFPAGAGLFLESGADNASYVDRMFISGSTGQVGIGTTTPTTMLDVRGHLNLQDALNNAVLAFPSTGEGLFFRTRFDDVSYANRMFISGLNGRVGIGTTTPNQLLDVAGGVSVEGTLFSANVDAALNVTAAAVKGNQLCIAGDCRTAWPASGGTITGVTPVPGGGLTGGGASGNVSLGVDFTATQRRITGSCGSGFAVRAVDQQGGVDCVPVAGGGGIGGSGTAYSVARFVDADTLAPSLISDDGNKVTISLNGGGLQLLNPDPNFAPPNETPNIIGGNAENSLARGIIGATISGGGEFASDIFSVGVLIPQGNIVDSSFGSIGGGYANRVQDRAGTVAGGTFNHAGKLATVAGGSFNSATGEDSVVPGGQGNHAEGKSSFAAGHGAYALHDGAFVWADSSVGLFLSTAPNQFLIHADGGVGIGTSILDPAHALTVSGTVKADKFIGDGSLLTNLPSGGGGTITGVTTGSGLTGGGTSGTVSLGIANAGVTNGMLQNSTVSVNTGPGSGLGGGGLVALGGNLNLSIPPGAVTNAMLQNSSISVNLPSNSGLTGGGAISLGSDAPLAVDFTSTQKRVLQTCGIGSAIRTVNENGSVACESVVSTGLTGTGSVNFLTKFTGAGTVGNALVFDNGTQVGIGTTAPAATLHVDSGTNGFIGGLFRTSAPGATALSAEALDSSDVNIGISGVSQGVGGFGVIGRGTIGVFGRSGDVSGFGGYFQNGDAGGKALVAVTNAGAEALTVRSSGNVGIQNPSPAEALDVNGNVKATGLCIGTDCRSAWPASGGTITGVVAGSGLTGGGTTGNVTLSIPTAGVTNSMLQSSTVTMNPGAGLTGGGPVALGGAPATFAIDTTVVPRLSTVNTFTAQQNVSIATLIPAITGVNTAAAGAGVGILGRSSSTTGRGVFGDATATSGVNYGVYGQTASPGLGAAGVFGIATSASGSNTGVYGTSASATGSGVTGQATASAGSTFGGNFQTSSPNGTGVFSQGGSFGVQSFGAGTGVFGEATNTTGSTNGVSGVALSSSGTGVRGLVSSTTGVNFGVFGSTSSASGFGVYSQGNAHVEGDLSYSGSLTQSSSRRWKMNIVPMTDALGKVQRLQGVTYDWKSTGRHDIGLIAEDVRLVVPEVVRLEENGVDAKGVDYARLSALLIEAIKEQQAQIRQLRATVDELSKRIGSDQP